MNRSVPGRRRVLLIATNFGYAALLQRPRAHVMKSRAAESSNWRAQQAGVRGRVVFCDEAVDITMALRKPRRLGGAVALGG